MKSLLKEAVLKFKIAISILWTLLTPLFVGAEGLTIMSENNPPFNFVKNGELTGSSMEIVREMMLRMNRPENIQIMTWAQAPMSENLI